MKKENMKKLAKKVLVEASSRSTGAMTAFVATVGIMGAPWSNG